MDHLLVFGKHCLVFRVAETFLNSEAANIPLCVINKTSLCRCYAAHANFVYVYVLCSCVREKLILVRPERQRGTERLRVMLFLAVFFSRRRNRSVLNYAYNIESSQVQVS